MKIMMFAHGGSLNRGCEAIVRSSTGIIKEGIGGAQVFLLSDRPDTDQIIGTLDHIYDGSSIPIPKYSPQWLMSLLRVRLFKDEKYALGKIHNNVIKQALQKAK
mgnify:FL=1